MSLEKIFSQLHEELANELLQRVRSGEATASELSVVRQFLNDNNVSGVPTEDNPLGQLADVLPSFDETQTSIN